MKNSIPLGYYAVFLLLLFSFTFLNSFAQETKKKKISFKDSLDGQFDMSDFLINAHGFIPIPSLITEPALGGIGGGLGAVFIQPKPPKINRAKGAPMIPTVYGVMGMYTANKSWAIGAGYMGEWDKIGLRYTFGTAYADMNMDFYKNFPELGKDVSQTFNFKTVPLYIYLRKEFLSYFTGGLKYIFSYTDVGLSHNDTSPYPIFNRLYEKIETKNYNSRLSPALSFDSRDNIFSPRTGFKVDAQVDWANEAIGSDFNYIQASVEGFGYFNPVDFWVSGYRLQWQQMFDDAPFYLLPYVNLRGIPTERYQGNVINVAETEQRFTFYKRWSAVAFAGVAKAYDEYSDFGSSEWLYNYGAGIRYLLARKFNLQMGLDFGFGPDSWGFYVVFGNAWFRD